MNTNSDFVSPLANEHQNQAEKHVLRIIGSPEVRAARVEARKVAAAHPVAKTPDGQARLDIALDERLAFLALQNVGSDVSIPRILWCANVTDYHWFGHDFPGSGAAIDCPDNIYRQAALNGSSNYEIIGKRHPLHPAQLSFHLTDHPGADGFAMTENARDIRGYQMYTTDNLVTDADGSFRITLDSKPAEGRNNHIQMPANGKFMLIMRDTCSDWKQSPNQLTLRHIGGAPLPAPISEQELIALTASTLSHHIAFWLRFMDSFPANEQSNTMTTPYGRTGSLGFASVGRYDLRDDQALIITAADIKARYAGMQVTDLWMIAPSPRKYLGSYSPAQVVPNPDRSKTYIISPRDPGYANWVDTAGIHQGWIQFRWQGVPAGMTEGDKLIHDVKVVDFVDIPKAVPASLPKVSPEQRRELVVQRNAEWCLRIAQ